MDKKLIEMSAEVYYAMNRLCEWTIHGNANWVYRHQDQPRDDALLVEQWINGSRILPARCPDERSAGDARGAVRTSLATAGRAQFVPGLSFLEIRQ